MTSELIDLFQGLGKLNDRQVVQPAAQHYRRVPFHVRKQIKKDEELGVID